MRERNVGKCDYLFKTVCMELLKSALFIKKRERYENRRWEGGREGAILRILSANHIESVKN